MYVAGGRGPLFRKMCKISIFNSIFSFLLQPPSRHLLTHRNSPNPQILPGVPLVEPELGSDFLLISRWWGKTIGFEMKDGEFNRENRWGSLRWALYNCIGRFYKDVMFLEQLLRVCLSGVEMDLHLLETRIARIYRAMKPTFQNHKKKHNWGTFGAVFKS